MARVRKCPCQGETLDRLVQPMILLLLSRRPSSGYRLLQALTETPMFRGQKPDAAGVYRCLQGMATRGLVKGAWQLPKRGPAQRAYKLTPEGSRCLDRWVKTLDDYRRDISLLLSMMRHRSRAARRWRALPNQDRQESGVGPRPYLTWTFS
jgi:PadR family transcriptional regulator PadR